MLRLSSSQFDPKRPCARPKLPHSITSSARARREDGTVRLGARVTDKLFAISRTPGRSMFYSRCDFASDINGRMHCVYHEYPEREERAGTASLLGSVARRDSSN